MEFLLFAFVKDTIPVTSKLEPILLLFLCGPKLMHCSVILCYRLLETFRRMKLPTWIEVDRCKDQCWSSDAMTAIIIGKLEARNYLNPGGGVLRFG